MPDMIVNGELTDEAAGILGHILASWMAFKDEHDLNDPKLRCCEVTQHLFKALDSYEKMVMRR